MIVVFPAPDGPTNAAICPGGIVNVTPLSALRSGVYENCTSSNAISPRTSCSTSASGFSAPSGSMSRYSKMRSKTASAETICTCTPASAEAGL